VSDSIGLSRTGRLAVLGMGRSGLAAGLLARRMLPGVDVVVIDAKPEGELGAGGG
jgi:D-arabinose 5-phosphate isomerase GutQ